MAEIIEFSKYKKLPPKKIQTTQTQAEIIKKTDMCCAIEEFVVYFQDFINNKIESGDKITAENASFGLVGVFEVLKFLKKRYDLPIKKEIILNIEIENGEKITKTINL